MVHVDVLGFEVTDRRAAETRAHEHLELVFPGLVSDEGDLGDLRSVGEHEVEVVPIPAALPALEIADNDEDPWLVAGLDVGGELFLVGGQFLVAQDAAEVDLAELVGFVVVQRDGHGGIG